MRTGLSVQVKLLPTSSQPNAAAGRSRFTSTNVCDVPDFHSSVSTTIPTLCIQATTIHVFPLSLPQDSTFFPSHAKMKVRLSNLKSKSSFQVLFRFYFEFIFHSASSPSIVFIFVDNLLLICSTILTVSHSVKTRSLIPHSSSYRPTSLLPTRPPITVNRIPSTGSISVGFLTSTYSSTINHGMP